MTVPQINSDNKFDIRQYIGLFVFYWRLIVLCLLLCLAGVTIYIQYVPKVYEASCALMVSSDPHFSIGRQRAHTPLQHFRAHGFILNSLTMKERVADMLSDEWASRVRHLRGGMMPEIRTGRGPLASSINISARGSHAGYLKAFLDTLVVEHETEWRSMRSEASDGAIEKLELELEGLETKIARAEEELIEYQRLHDIARIEAFGRYESSQLSSLISRRGQLSTEIMLLESQFPFLRDADMGVLDSVDQMTRDTAMMAMLGMEADAAASLDRPATDSGLHPMTASSPGQSAEAAAAMRGWQELRVQLARLLERDEELALNMTSDHPRRVALLNEINAVRRQMDTQTRIRMQQMLDRRQAMEIQLQALGDAEQSWQARNLLASRRRSELNRIASVVRRFENNYGTLYARLHDLRVEREIDTETFRVIRPVRARSKPVWPDVQKLLLMALAVGLGSGFGLTLLLDFFGNRVQFPKDVEQDLQKPYLAGIPFWAHCGLENMVRPTVIEQDNTAAVESYRTLRTAILSGLERMNEKVVIFSSADSCEGKTLTSLNVAILTAKLGKRTLLLDMDLRRGRLHRSLDLPRVPGISEALYAGRGLGDVVLSTRFENLDFAPSGESINNAAEYLHGNALSDLLEPLRSEYDYIFIDTPPVLRAAESMSICNQRVGAVVFMTRANHTSKPLVRYAFNMIKDARILGVVVNSIELHRISSLYYIYQYPNASYSYYEYGHYGEDDYGNPVSRFLGRCQRRTVRWLRRRITS